jgi:hypothetical protein
MLVVHIESSGAPREALAAGGPVELRIGASKFMLRRESQSTDGSFLLVDASTPVAPAVAKPVTVPLANMPAPKPVASKQTASGAKQKQMFGEDHED